MSMNSNRFRHALLGASAMVSAAAVAGAAYAADARAYDFDMPAQPLTLALKTFGATADQQLIFSETLVKDRTAPALKGAYTSDQALAMLLNGSGLTADKTPGGVVTIRSASDPQSGSAAGAGADNGTVQALIVTAQKREEDIQDVPIAISAFTQEDLTRSQVAGGPDLMTQVPNMTFTKTNFSSYSIQLRGIGTQAISATTDPAVAVAFNNTPFVRNHFFEQEFYDLERVEVLRGPQGTLYGRNATAGVVNIISAKPKFRYEAKLSGDVGNYNNTRLEGMVNIPLVEDKVALRLAGAWTKRDGYATNQITGNPIDGRDLWSTRVSLRISPNDRIDANLIWEHFQEDDDRIRSGKQLCKTDTVTTVAGIVTNGKLNEEGGQGGGGDNDLLDFAGPNARFSQGCQPSSLYSPDSFGTPEGHSLPYYVPLGALGLPTALHDPYVSRTQSHDLRVIESTVDPKYRAKADAAELQVKFELTDSLTLTSESAWASDFIFSTQDYNRFNTAPGAWSTTDGNAQTLLAKGILSPGGVFCDPQIGCADRLVAVDLSTGKSRQFSQELRLASDYSGPFNFSLGANFLRYDTVEKYYVFINSLTLYAASQTGQMSYTWQPGVTDNRQCLQNGPTLPDPNTVYEVFTTCQYVDPNSIENLNDQGHNYFLSKNPYKLISYAVFGEAYYQIADDLKLTAGLRWTVDKKEAPRIPSWILGGNTVGYSIAEVVEQEWREPTGRLTIDWKPHLNFTDETLLYGSYAHGYKAGGANPPAAGVVVYSVDQDDKDSLLGQSATKPRTFDPEFVDAFEVGAKNTLFDGKATLNLASFYYDYNGYQISYITDRSAVNLNFDAKVWGLEMEADWRPLENLRLGFKGGYEKTRVNDGERAIDVMDRTAGKPGWLVVKPFPTFSNNCILPAYMFVATASSSAPAPYLTTPDANGNYLLAPSDISGGGLGPCERAYLRGVDPVTNLPYVANPTVSASSNGTIDPFNTSLLRRPGYPGFNPFDPQINHGEGFYKELGGHELPNAPHFTATVTADYTVPLPNSWLMTLHTDLYYQSEAWTRIFNTPGYDKLKAYTNVNFAAIFSNDDAGWRVMAYVKNVFDRDSITGAFLNSDDSGLTTNVFLTEPRLYGLRVTKEWTGEGWWSGANPNHPAGVPYPLTIELGGTIQRQDAPYGPLRPSFIGNFSEALQPEPAQNQDLDWGDGREVKVTYAPAGSPWRVSGGLRVGRTNGTNKMLATEVGSRGCMSTTAFCAVLHNHDPKYYFSGLNYNDLTVVNREEHTLADFVVGRDLGLGMGIRSNLAAGLRYAGFKSDTDMEMFGVPNWHIPAQNAFALPSTRTNYTSHIEVGREFKGEGPILSWEASHQLLGNDQTGLVNLDWSIAGGVLFGKQKVHIQEDDESVNFRGKYFNNGMKPFGTPVTSSNLMARSKSTSAPVLDLSLGLSYDVQRVKVSTGYRWERYYNVLDAGYAEHKSYDRTIDGPYFKVSVGFGG